MSNEPYARDWDCKYLVSVLSSNVCVSVAFAIVAPTLVANLREAGASSFQIAVVSSIWALPSVVGGPVFTRFVARFDAKRWLTIGVLSYALLLTVFPLFRNIVAWTVLQVLSGFLLGHFYVVTEAWLNLFSTDVTRGRTTAIYGIVPAAGYLVGSQIYAQIGFRGYTPFLVSAAIVALGLAPLLSVRGSHGNGVVGGETRLAATAREVPLLLVTAWIAGMFQTTAWGVFQVYILAKGFPLSSQRLVLSAFFAGQIVLTYPIGWLGDRMDKRVLVIWMGAITAVVFIGTFIWGRTPFVWFALFICGGVSCAIYTLGLALLGHRFHSRMLASAGASYMAAYSIGAVIGVPFLGAFMDRFGSSALPFLLASAALVLTALAIGARSEWRPRVQFDA
jgi:MFS family permease